MSRLWSNAKSWTQQLGTRRVQQQQWKDADSVELRKLASEPSEYVPGGYQYQDTPSPYRPYSNYYADVFVDPNDNKAYSRGTRRYTQGWRFGAINCAISASVVFLINFIVTIWGSVHDKGKGGILMEGDCEEVRRTNTGLHFLINLLSTILLSSSNYCMQCLSAPTRNEIDQAHAKGTWLDIGVPSIHNLRQINKKRVILWVCLGLSSLPLHLFYNSAVFSSISSNNYYVFSVSQSFVDNAECYNCGNISNSSYPRIEQPVRDMHAKAHNGSLERLSNSDCLNAYAEMIQSNRRNLLLVARDDKFPAASQSKLGATNVYAYDTFDAVDASSSEPAVNAYSWMCEGSEYYDYYKNPCVSAIDKVKSSPDVWRVGASFGSAAYDTGAYPVEYCLSEKAEPHCKLQFVPPIAILVTILNLFKAVIIFYTAFAVKEEPLMTMGDAVASFLEKKDPTTKGMCLLSVRDVKKHKGYFPAGPKEWTDKKYRWKDVASRTRRGVTTAMFTIILVVVTVLMSWGIRALPDTQSRSLPALAKLGYGAIDPRTIISFGYSISLVSSVLIANIAQPILSFLYFSYNGLFTCMLLGYEWASYAQRRKGLRVSRAPAGAQRSTYFLQLPYRFALPLMALSGVLHWLVSQSIFLVAVDVYTWDGGRHATSPFSSGGDWKSCGYSPIAIISVLVLGILMTFAMVGFGFIPYKPGMNLAGSCSAAISAACHNTEWDDVHGHVAAMEKLKWGVVGMSVDGEGHVGHCTFSTREVDMPTQGVRYAG